jgi:hypothetical protein
MKRKIRILKRRVKIWTRVCMKVVPLLVWITIIRCSGFGRIRFMS